MRNFLLSFFFLAIFLPLNSQAQTVKEWTVLVYMNSDNNLWPYGETNFAEMERVGSTDQVNMLVQQDPRPGNMPTTRYYVTRNEKAQPGKPTSQVVQQLGETNMGDPRTLADFLVWGAKNYPAKHYAVIIWDHGDGWKGVSFDDNPMAHLEMPQLREGLSALNRFLKFQRGLSEQGTGPQIDIVNFDACLMATLEVGYELKEQARILVGSQFLEPAPGEDYTQMLLPLAAQPQMTAVQFAQTMVYQYTLRYAQTNRNDINYIALDLGKIASFTGAFNQTAELMLATSPEIRRQLINGFSNPGYGGFDLINVIKVSQLKAKADLTLSKALEALVQLYGYPNDPLTLGQNGQGLYFHVVRYSPGVVYYGQRSGSPKTMPLTAHGDGSYEAYIPTASGEQYYVKSDISFVAQNRAPREALSFVLRAETDPIVYHTGFPVTSPVIADAHTLRTKGAYGVTLYSLAGFRAVQAGQTTWGSDIIERYRRLQFAMTGSPAWLKVFGLSF